jgi:hypothetical protein
MTDNPSNPSYTLIPGIDIATYCKSRAIFIASRNKPGLLFNLNRYDVASPYDAGYTQYQLDMRRKAEVLKYRAVGGDGGGFKTNNFTKKQIWSKLANQVYTIKHTANYSNIVCPSANIISTPSTASGVPGPNIPLFLDPSIPLYNFQNQNLANAYAITLTDSQKS